MPSLDSHFDGDPSPRVLLAEDDSVTRHILQHWLQAWGYEVVQAKDGAEAWRILQQERSPQLVIADWVMPEMDGIELCRRLRDDSHGYYHYILMITGRDDRQDIIRALEAGADHCLAKPFEESDLRARLNVARRILSLQDQLIDAREELRARAMKDSLTGIWNRAAFAELFERELARADRSHDQTGLLLLDLDNFKRINDAYGHLAGDIVLKEAARLLKQNVRSYDFVGRYGGEEFVIAFPGCSEREIYEHAERIRRSVSDKPIRAGAIDISITFSIGAAITSPNKRTMSEIMTIADVALYRAKDAGRNCTVYCLRPPIQILQAPGTPRACCADCDPVFADHCTVSTSVEILQRRSAR